MNKGNIVPAESVVVVDFQNYKIRSIAQEYVRLLAEYGVEAASLWSMDKVTDNIEKSSLTSLSYRKCVSTVLSLVNIE
jgi:hypothetical protein